VPPETLVALGCWAVLAVIVSVKVLIAPAQHTVFPKFAAGAMHWWSHQPLYANYEGLGPFRYSPTFAIAMTPFAVLGPRAGGVLWCCANIGVFVWGVRRLVRDVLPGDWPPNREMVLLVVTLIVALAGVWNSQSNPLAAGLLMAACSCLRRGRAWRSAGLLAAAVAVKLALLAPALLLAAIWRRQLAIRLPTALAVAAAVPFVTVPPTVAIESYAGWYGHLATTSTLRWPSFRDAWTIWELIAGAVNVRAYRLVQVVAGLAVLAWCLRLQRRRTDGRTLLTLTLAIGLAYLMLFGPAVEAPTYAIAAPLMAWALIESVDTRFARPLTVLGVATIALLGSGDVQRAVGAHVRFVTAALPMGTAMIALWLILYAQRCPPVVAGQVPSRN
jgi:hypothetical protein